jgi:hypothetical protein
MTLRRYSHLFIMARMLKPHTPSIVLIPLICALLGLPGCHPNFSISAPAQPTIDPSDYSTDDYNTDVKVYQKAATPGADANPELARETRNNIVYGLMTQIDVVYGAYYNRLFSSKNGIAVGGDALTLGLSTAATIATHGATKTLLSALGTGFSGLNLSVDKNYFAQQTFPVIGVAMQTRRDKVRAAIVANLAFDTAMYPLMAAKRDLIAYLNAGTLASGLQELQEETTSKTVPSAPANAPQAPSSLAAAAAGDSQITLLWANSATATSYNLYYSMSPGVTMTTGTKVPGIAPNPYTQSGLKDGIPYYFVVTAVNANGESVPSTEAHASPPNPARQASGAAAPPPPTGLAAVAGNLQVSLLWDSAVGAKSYNLYYSTTKGVSKTNSTKVPGIPTNTYTQPLPSNGVPYYFVVAAVDANNNESELSSEVPATPSAPVHSEQILTPTPH